MQSIAILNQKSGIGKTTCALNIGAGLARLGKRVLFIDLDPRSHLTHALNIDVHKTPKTMYELLSGQAVLEEVLIRRHNISILPASKGLSAFEKKYTELLQSEFMLRSLIKTIRYIDYIIVDCAPNLELLTLNALAGVQELIIPVPTNYQALQELSQLIDMLNVITLRINPALRLGGIIPVRYCARTVDKDFMSSLSEAFNDKVFATFIREDNSINHALSIGLDVFSYDPRSLGAQDFEKLCKEIIEKHDPASVYSAKMWEHIL